jgi:cell shape-determining protein MreC
MLGGLGYSTFALGILAVVLLVVTDIGPNPGGIEQTFLVLVVLVWSAAAGLTLLAYADLVSATVDNERNTRRTYELLEELLEELQSRESD